MDKQPEYVAIQLAELTSLQQRLAIANSELERLTADNARYLLALRSLATWAEDAIKGGSPVVVREQPRWIPVGEKLPIQYTDILCVTDDDRFCVCYYDIDSDFRNKSTRLYFGGITHWMPLPEPPDGQP